MFSRLVRDQHVTVASEMQKDIVVLADMLCTSDNLIQVARVEHRVIIMLSVIFTVH